LCEIGLDLRTLDGTTSQLIQQKREYNEWLAGIPNATLGWPNCQSAWIIPEPLEVRRHHNQSLAIGQRCHSHTDPA
jgi:hypothetical protein